MQVRIETPLPRILPYSAYSTIGLDALLEAVDIAACFLKLLSLVA